MLITTYLRDHHMGSAAGVDFFQRVAETHGEQEVRDVVGRLADEIEEDQAALQEILDRFDASPNPVKDVLAKVGEKAARLKPNQRLGTRSPLADVLDLEVLTDAVHAKSRDRTAAGVARGPGSGGRARAGSASRATWRAPRQ